MANRHDPEEEKRSVEWIESIKIDIDSFTPSSKWTISKVPQRLHKINPAAYTPSIVSIGPFHRENENFQTMEYNKWNYLKSLMYRTPDRNLCLEECGRAMLASAWTARSCYSDIITQLAPNKFKFAEIMLLDGCFLLELFIRYRTCYEADPIFKRASMIYSLRRDLGLMENQIPFFILENLFNIVSEHCGESLPYSLPLLVLNFYKPTLIFPKEVDRHVTTIPHACLLDLIHNSCMPIHPTVTRGKFETIPSAMELWFAGIDFKVDKRLGLFGIKMNSKGLIEMPPLNISEATESLFKNLIAFEQCNENCSHYFTSYILLMAQLIQTPSDVKILQHRKIIDSDLDSREKIAKMFDSLLKEVIFNEFYFTGVCKEISDYYKKSRTKGHRRLWYGYRAVLRREYCANPWKIMSLIAVIFVLLLTTLQTTEVFQAPPSLCCLLERDNLRDLGFEDDFEAEGDVFSMFGDEERLGIPGVECPEDMSSSTSSTVCDKQHI